jgi:hypothetical protein
MLNLCNKHTLKSALLTNATETIRKQKDTNKFDRKTLSVNKVFVTLDRSTPQGVFQRDRPEN